MESFVNGVDPSSKTQAETLKSTIVSNSVISMISQPCEALSTTTRLAASVEAPCMKTACHPNGSVINQQHPLTVENDRIQREGSPNMALHFYSLHTGKPKFMESAGVLISKPEETPSEKKVLMVETMDDSRRANSSSSLESESIISVSCEGSEVGQLNNHVVSESATSFCTSPSISVYTATSYAEATPSFTNAEASEEASTVEKSGECGEVSNSCDPESRMMSISRGSTDSNVSDESSSSTLSSALYKPHKANDVRWEAIQSVRSRVGQQFGLNQFKLLRRLGCGDIGSVYLSELAGTRTCFAMKLMDKATLAARKKLLRAQTEREILQSLDHPFLPTLYTHFETEKYSCLVMEFCPGGDLHALRQRQHGKYFPENAARFYVAEVLLALEYLHMLGIIYRDLKPENVLVREDGHIMLSDFDLSLRCAVCPTLVKSSNSSLESKNQAYCAQPACIEPTCLVQPDCIQPACFGPRFLSGKRKKDKKTKTNNGTTHQVIPLPELIAEPTSARSMSFVGTHEYLAPEIIKGEGHGSAVDWWTLGVFLYELLYGKTPFKGQGNRATLFNVVGQPLRFPELPTVSFAARDLIRGLLVKEPQHRLAYRRGATEIKQHPFFRSVNWALIRCANPPEVPKQAIANHLVRADANVGTNLSGGDVKTTSNYYDIDFF